MTTRTKSQKITCPCCGKDRATVDGPSLAQLEDKLLEANLSPWWNSKEGWSIEEASKGKLQWACRYCLRSGRAIEANPVVQKFCDYSPYLAYFDVQLRCEDCASKFVFEAKEQQFWYEELKFWVQSRPKQCATCRKLRRERKGEQNKNVEWLSYRDAQQNLAAEWRDSMLIQISLLLGLNAALLRSRVHSGRSLMFIDSLS